MSLLANTFIAKRQNKQTNHCLVYWIADNLIGQAISFNCQTLKLWRGKGGHPPTQINEWLEGYLHDIHAFVRYIYKDLLVEASHRKHSGRRPLVVVISQYQTFHAWPGEWYPSDVVAVLANQWRWCPSNPVYTGEQNATCDMHPHLPYSLQPSGHAHS